MTEPEAPSLDDVMTRRFELDEQIAIIQGQQKLALEPLAEELKLCETYIKNELNTSGAQSWKSQTTGHMTFFTTKDSVKVENMDDVIGYMLAAAPIPDFFYDAITDGVPHGESWTNIINHIRTHGLWSLLNNAVNKSTAKEIIERDNAPPPGTSYSSYRDLSWKRGKK